MKEPIKLGDTVQDKVSGFSGLVTSRTDSLYASAQLYVEPQHTEGEGKLIAGEWFTEARLDRIEKAVEE